MKTSMMAAALVAAMLTVQPAAAQTPAGKAAAPATAMTPEEFDKRLAQAGVIVSFQQIDTVAAGQAVGSPMRRLGM